MKKILIALAVAAGISLVGAAPAQADNGPSLCWNGWIWNACIQGPGWGWNNHWDNHWDNGWHGHGHGHGHGDWD